MTPKKTVDYMYKIKHGRQVQGQQAPIQGQQEKHLKAHHHSAWKILLSIEIMN